MCNEAVHIEPLLLAYVPDRFKTQEMCNEAVRNKPCMLLVPDHLKISKTCNEIMHTMPLTFHSIPDQYKTQEMCKKAIEADPSNLVKVLDHLKAQEMYDDGEGRLFFLGICP